MKKLFLSFAVIASLGLVSCGNKAAEDATPVEEAESTEVVEEAAEAPAEEATAEEGTEEAPAEEATEAPAENA